MISINATVDTSVLDAKIKAAIAKAPQAVQKIIKNVACNFSQAASKASGPAVGVSRDRMTNAFKKRPIVDMPENHGYWYIAKTKTAGDEIFHSTIKLAPKVRRETEITQVKKGVKWWNKKISGWDYFPFVKGVTSEKKLKIPHWGFAKWGWTGAAAKLGKGESNKYGSAKVEPTVGGCVVTVHNMIKYASKMLPSGALQKAVNASVKMIDHVYFKDEIKKAFR